MTGFRFRPTMNRLVTSSIEERRAGVVDATGATPAMAGDRLIRLADRIVFSCRFDGGHWVTVVTVQVLGRK